jgi:aerobic-type carbon monoxide dehydrogenase small subunit (CoxS/CutS family)
MTKRNEADDGKFSRRGFLKGTSLGVAASTVLGGARAEIQEASPFPAARVLGAGETHTIAFTLNGEAVKAEVRTGHTLLETLRDNLHLTGTKLVCDFGSCGACTVLVDGQAVNSCLTLAADAEGRSVETIEGLAKGQDLHPLQTAFAAEDALQCGFCTPGMIMSCKSLLDHHPSPSLDQTKEALSGNLCRCGTYINIFRAVDRASKTLKGGK